MISKPGVCLAMSFLAAFTLRRPCAAEGNAGLDERVTACVEKIGDGYADRTAEMAQVLATRIFKAIGVSIRWHRGTEDCPSNAIVVTFPPSAPWSVSPAAFASALPFEGIHLEVYYWRIPPQGQSYEATLMGYLLVHEITHLFEGLPNHARSGIMKARWDTSDINQMLNSQLHFDKWEIARIREGIRSRPSRLAANRTYSNTAKLLAAIP